jgi:hypothetical protein
MLTSAPSALLTSDPDVYVQSILVCAPHVVKLKVFHCASGRSVNSRGKY